MKTELFVFIKQQEKKNKYDINIAFNCHFIFHQIIKL